MTIIDLPEGEHQYKYFVDGEWRHDPTVVCSSNTFYMIPSLNCSTSIFHNNKIHDIPSIKINLKF